MALPVRTQIRNAVKAAITGLTTTGSSVYTRRQHDFADADLPCLNIIMGDEDLDYITANRPRLLDRAPALAIEIRVKKSIDIDAELDVIIAEVETAMAADITLGGLCDDVQLSHTGVEDDAAGAKPIGKATMVFAITYSGREGQP